MTKLLLLQVGHTFPEVARERGDYDAWFQAGLGVADGAFQAVQVAQGEPLPSNFDYAGIVVSGSAAMVTDRAEWSEATAAYLREAMARVIPILGVCYGHQLLADAFGGVVADNPRGRQVGTIEVLLTPEAAHDPLFGELPSCLVVQASHRQSVLALPPQAQLLGACPRDPHQAFRLGESAWGVQFHPEFDAVIARAYIEARREILVSEGRDPDAMVAMLRESDHGTRLLRRFATLTGVA